MKEREPSVLIVDDQPANLLALEALLDDPRMRLIGAASGEEALLLLEREEPFALVLLDVRMPGLDGFETAEILRQRETRPARTPIIFLTAGSAEEDRVARAYSLGAVDFIAKPIVPEILRAKVKVFVELFQMTEEIKAQAERLRRSDELEARERLQRRFVATVSHELRTPIAAIRASAETLRRGGLDDARHRLGFVSMIERNADRLRWLVEDVLAINALESGLALPAPRRVDVREALEAALAAIPESSARRRVRVTRESRDAAALVDQAHLARVALDLLERALRHSPKRGLVAVDVRREGSEIRVSICDSGKPPAADELAHLFAQFHRSADPRRLPDRGLGLHALKTLIEANGGRIWAETPAGRGLSVVFTLRAAPDSGAAAPAAEKAQVAR